MGTIKLTDADEEAANTLVFQKILRWDEEEGSFVAVKNVMNKSPQEIEPETYKVMAKRIVLTVRLSSSERTTLKNIRQLHECLKLKEDDVFLDAVWLNNIRWRWAGEEDWERPWRAEIEFLCSSS